MPAVSYRPRYTIDNYLQWEGDWELWDGVPVAMSPSPDYFLVDLEERSAQLLEWKEGSYAERPADSPFELHPGCRLHLEIASHLV